MIYSKRIDTEEYILRYAFNFDQVYFYVTIAGCYYDIVNVTATLKDL